MERQRDASRHRADRGRDLARHEKLRQTDAGYDRLSFDDGALVVEKDGALYARIEPDAAGQFDLAPMGYMWQAVTLDDTIRQYVS